MTRIGAEVRANLDSMSRDRAALSAFLRDRRDRLTPAEVGLPTYPGARRVPGLRREELAQLAGVSPDYYSKLEQGRQANISDEVLRALARALRLDEVEAQHLRDLASPNGSRVVGLRAADPGLLRIMEALDHIPTILLGPAGEILATNALLRAVLSLSEPVGGSLHHYLFRNPVARERIVNWSEFAAGAVAGLRRESARRPNDRSLTTLIDELRATELDFSRWWDDHEVQEFAGTTKIIQHPAAGTLQFGIEFVCTPTNSEQSLIVYTVERDSTTEKVLPILASWDTVGS